MKFYYFYRFYRGLKYPVARAVHRAWRMCRA
jgi:hypothetical protein